LDQPLVTTPVRHAPGSSPWLTAIGVIAVSSLAFAAIPKEAVGERGGTLDRIPRPDHVVIVIEENKAYGQIIGNMAAPYINTLANGAALFTRSFAVMHPSQPNYLALFSGRTHGVIDNRCPISLSGDNLASVLKQSGLGFAIYSESMPSIGYTGCASGHYQRKHNPAANWQGINVVPEMNLPLDLFPADYSRLPTVSIVVPNQLNDMHDGQPLEAINRADKWLKDRVDPYLRWAAGHNSLLILTWDEDDGSSENRIATIFAGPMVKRGIYGARIDHYHVLRTITDMYDLPPLGESRRVAPIRGIWKP
jgi:phosphatidylinositol-3-phosphatase